MSENRGAMGSLVQLSGDLPGWIGAATGAAGLYLGLRDRQQQQALDWAQTLEKLAGLPPDELRHVIEDNPVIAQMVDLAWEEAARTASEEKRRLLAKVVVAAIRGDADAEVDALPFLLRAVMALDPAHVMLLVVLATPERPAWQTDDDPPEPGTEWDELRRRWAGPADLLHPALAALEREGLIDGKRGLGGGVGWWALRPFGRRFFDFLERSGEPEPSS